MRIDMVASTEPFYVYVIRDPRPDKNNAPIYVGKGTRNRAHSHLRQTSHNKVLERIITTCRKLGIEPSVEIVARFSNEKAAFKSETALIKKYGRYDLGTGTLFNFTNGGEGVSGFRHSETMRKQFVEDAKRRFASPKWRNAYTEMIKRRSADPAWQALNARLCQERWNDPTYRATQTAALIRRWEDNAFCEKITKANRLRTSTTEWRLAYDEGIQRRAINPEWRKSVATAAKQRSEKPENREAHSKGQQRRYTNPEERKKASEIAARRNADPEYRRRLLAGLQKRDAARRCRKQMSDIEH
jgi:hypothetical protein